MKRKTKFFLTIILSLCIFIVSTGCLFTKTSKEQEYDGSHMSDMFSSPERYNRNQIDDYIQKEIGIDNYTLANNYEKDKNDNYSHIWKVIDENNNFEFCVVDTALHTTSLNSGVKLINNYDYQLFMNELYDDWNYDVCEEPFPFYDDFRYVRLTAIYNNKYELDNILNNIEEIQNKSKDKYNHKISLGLSLNFNIVSYDIFTNIEILQSTFANTNQSIDDIREAVEFDYYSSAMTYDIDEIVDNMTIKQKETIFNRKGTTRILKKNEEEPYKYLVGNISYSNLYYILMAEGIEVDGTPKHFTTTDILGQKYEFSFDYYRYCDEYDVNESYYYVDGKEHIDRGSFLHVYPSFLSKFGIQVEFDYAK